MAKHFHFMGIGGVGMAGLAILMKSEGYEVSGCDLYSTDRTRYLESLGIKVLLGHDSKHLESVDELVITPAVHADNSELLAFGGKIRYRGELLAEIVSKRESIAVCGSHGKTTTSTYIAKLLKALGEDVAWAIGGETGGFPVGSPGNGERGTVLVVEADESDGTLSGYHATTLVVNKLEYDHPDHFKTPEMYFECFETAKRQAGDVVESEKLEVLEALEVLDSFTELAPHNKKNARAAVEVALRRGHKIESILAAIPTAVEALPDRRFEKITEGVYTDYAHHPTEMKCAVEMARKICRGCLRVLFQPHRYSRTKALISSFPDAFEGADEVVLCPTYAAFEPRLLGGTISDLYKVCRENGVNVKLARSLEEAWTHAALSHNEGDLTLLLGAGDIIKLAKMAKNGEILPKRVHYIGMGSNTWKSELKTNEEYVKTLGRAGEAGASLIKKYPTLCPWMAGIPGTIGGWIKMNAGAFGHEISEVISRVKVDGKWLTKAECGFKYRHSDIKGEIQDYELIGVGPVSAEATPWQARSTEENSAFYLAKRKKFPAGTWGSFFKNPEGDFAGRLLEEAGAKELRVGGAYVWCEHANVIVAGKDATSSDVLALSRLMQDAVFARFGIVLCPEVQGIISAF